MKSSAATSPSRSRIFLHRSAQAILAVGAIAGGVAYSNWLLAIDPFAKYKIQQREDPSEAVGIELKDVDFVMYDGADKLGECLAKTIEVRKDRNRVDLYGVKAGKLIADKREFKFDTPHAIYEQRNQQLTALEGIRLRNKDMDLKAAGFAYQRKTDRLTTEGKITGKLFGGEIAASKFVYVSKTDSFSAGPVKWTGDGAKLVKEDLPGLQAKSRWTIESQKVDVRGDIWNHTKGFATDGEVIVRADRIEHNRKSDVVTATGNVKYFSAKANMTCEKVVVYRREKRAVLTGSITMLVKPQDQERLEEVPIPPFRPIVPDSIASARPAAPAPADQGADRQTREGNSARKYPTQVWAERIEYWYQKGSRRAEISGSPQARQDIPGGGWRHLWSHHASYDAEGEKLFLKSSNGKKDVRVKNSVGDDLRADWFNVSTRENQEDEWEAGGVTGTVVSDDGDLNNRNNPPDSGQKPPFSGPIGR